MGSFLCGAQQHKENIVSNCLFFKCNMLCVMTSLRCFMQINFFNNFFFFLQRSKNIVKNNFEVCKIFQNVSK